MTSGDLEGYVRAIERHFRVWRGADHVLSPKDFALARSWHEAEVPLAVVLVGIDRAFESDPQASSLAFCRRRIEDLALGLAPHMRSSGRETVPLSAVEEALRGLEERLLELSVGARGAFSLVLPRVRELLDFVTVATRPNWDHLRAKLREVDEAVGDAAPLALDQERAQAIAKEAARAAERHKGRVDEASLERALERLTRARARESLRLPRVHLL